MGYIDLVKKNADATDIQAFLIGGNQTAITIRIPENLRDSAVWFIASPKVKTSIVVFRATITSIPAETSSLIHF